MRLFMMEEQSCITQFVLMCPRSLETKRNYSPMECNMCMFNNVYGPHRGSVLFKCGGCKMVWYCGKEHQRKDWPNHMALCNAIKRIMSYYKVGHPLKVMGDLLTKVDVEIAVHSLKDFVRTAIGRTLRYSEQEVLSFPVYCFVCHKLTNLTPCVMCYAAFYCSFEHAEQDALRHNKICGTYKLYYSPFRLRVLQLPFYIDIKQPVKRMIKSHLYEAIEEAAQLKLPLSPADSFRDYRLFSAAADFSCVATICFVMEFIPQLLPCTQPLYTLYIVGATPELMAFFREEHIKFIFVQYPHITTLCINFIGPALVGLSDQITQFEYLNVQRNVEMNIFQNLFVKFEKPIAYPCMFAAFNCDFSRYEPMPGHQVTYKSAYYRHMTDSDWVLDLDAILALKIVPFMFTSFTEVEATLDYFVVKSREVFAVPPRPIRRHVNMVRNPYRDLRPRRNMRVTDIEEIYYRNKYVQLVITGGE